MKTLFYLILFSISFKSFSQNSYTIDYTNVGVVPEYINCNVFANPTTISGYTHLTTFGRPMYGYFNCNNEQVSAIRLEMSGPFLSNSGDMKVDAYGYSIAFNFKKNYTYEISVFGKLGSGGSNNPLVGNIGLAISPTNGGENHTCNSSYVLANTMNIYSQASFDNYICNDEYVWVTPIKKNIDQNASHLLVAAIAAYPNGQNTLYIKKIIIKETPSILPLTVNIPCGSTSPITFNMENGNIPNTLGYTWNLGTTPNGWNLTNGNPAPQSISTTSPTLTLMPACSNTPPSSVSATIIVGPQLFNTNSVLTNIIQPSLSISGNTSLICGSETYSINNLPCNATVSWSTAGTGVVSPSSFTGSSVTLTKVTTGDINLTAAVTACGITTTLVTPSIRVGGYTSSDLTLSSSNGTSFYCFGTSLSFFVNNLIAGLDNRAWSYPSNWTTITGGLNSNYVAVIPQSQSGPPLTPTITFSATSCGLPLSATKIVSYSSSVCSGAALYSISPNPTSSYIYIQSNYPQTTKICAAQITDMSGNVLINEVYSCIETTHYLNLYGLSSGPKVAKIYNGNQWYSYQFSIL